MLQKLYDWVDERLDITPMWRDIADHEVPEHVNPAHHCVLFRRLDFFYRRHSIFIGDVFDDVLCTRHC